MLFGVRTIPAFRDLSKQRAEDGLQKEFLLKVQQHAALLLSRRHRGPFTHDIRRNYGILNLLTVANVTLTLNFRDFIPGMPWQLWNVFRPQLCSIPRGA